LKEALLQECVSALSTAIRLCREYHQTVREAKLLGKLAEVHHSSFEYDEEETILKRMVRYRA